MFSILKYTYKKTRNLCIITILSCAMNQNGLYSTQYPHLEQPENPDWITIFLHGTISPDICLQNLIKIVKDKIDRSAYALTTELIRNDPFFHQSQIIQQLGLQRIDQPQTAAYVFATIYDQLGKKNEKKQIKTAYYTFGWSGLISYKQREKEAGIFYNQLKEELSQYHKRNCFPHIRIIGYSHGGNIALNLASVQKKQNPEEKLSIDELVLIGMPVQQATDHLIDDPLFKHVYHFYSLGDNVQRIDFATRRFLNRKTFNIPRTKLTQIKISLEGTSTKHPGIYRKRHIDPGHIELWFFGWTPRMYRKRFTCRPLPVAILIQWLLNAMQDCAPAKDSLEFDIDFIHAQATIRCYRSAEDPRSFNRKSSLKQIIDFPREAVEDMKAYALTIAPEKGTYSRTLHQKRRAWARMQANYFKRMYRKATDQRLKKKRYNPQHVIDKKRRHPQKLLTGNTITRHRLCLNRQSIWF